MSEIEKPEPNETSIIGNWIESGGAVIGDPTCERIQFLTTDYLTELGKNESGWDILYQDPEHGRYWERVYRNSNMHGGGPPALFSLTENEALKKYSNLFSAS